MQYVDTALLILCLSGLLGLRVWVYGQLQDIRDKMAQHENKNDLHVPEDALVKKEICAMQIRLITQTVKVVADSVTKLEKTVVATMAELKTAIQRDHGHGAD